MQKAGVRGADQYLLMLKLLTFINEQLNTGAERLKDKYGVDELCTAAVGTERSLFIQDLVGQSPYLKEKTLSEDVATEVAERLKLRKLGDGEWESDATQWLRIIAVANSLEFDLVDVGDDPLGYLDSQLTSALHDGLNSVFEKQLPEVLDRLRAAEHVLILTDNAGEHVFDLLFAEYLTKMGKSVVVAGKGAPVQNDATIEDLAKTAKRMGISARTASTGGQTVGLFLKLTSESFKDEIRNSEFVIAKGMGHYESLRDVKNLPFNGAIVFRAKCTTIAQMSGLQLGEYGIRSISKTCSL